MIHSKINGDGFVKDYEAFMNKLKSIVEWKIKKHEDKMIFYLKIYRLKMMKSFQQLNNFNIEFYLLNYLYLFIYYI